jgi:hypothetical protein
MLHQNSFPMLRRSWRAGHQGEEREEESISDFASKSPIARLVACENFQQHPCKYRLTICFSFLILPLSARSMRTLRSQVGFEVMAKEEDADWRRRWLAPSFLLAAIALVSFAVLFTIDHYFTGCTLGKDCKPAWLPKGPLSRYLAFEEGLITDAVSSLGGMIAAVLGIVITVVSIVVQLSAERYTRVATMFFRDRTNILVLSFYVISCVCGIWLSVSLRQNFVPRLTLIATMMSTTAGLVLMAPYFAYVFWFLEPANIINRIRREALVSAEEGTKHQSNNEVFDIQANIITAMEELTDITSNSISGKDKIIASNAVDALKDFVVNYTRFKQNAAPIWFRVGPQIRGNPDFVAMDPESLSELEGRKTWVEWKAMRQYLGVYNEALQNMRDINYLIAINTRYIGEAAIKTNDQELITLALRYMNSYLRATLNARDVRTAYNILNQYRLLIESLLRSGDGEAAIRAVGHMKYYGHVSFDIQLSFVAETVAYDVCALVALAHSLKSSAEEQLLRAFLDLDRPLSERGQEQGLKGVRKAQVKLAAYYIAVGEEAKAQRIKEDVCAEPYDRLSAIRTELERVETKDFWEIIDRGRNFEYMPPEQKAGMRTFFDWIGIPSVSAPQDIEA